MTEQKRPLCDMQLRDCERDADYELTMTDREEDWTLVHYCCSRHIGWYRQTYEKERDYEFVVEDLE